ncbi:hypothetical protein [Pseudohongiella sp.]|uniref:Mu-like prophage FluMu N-terminal domain-containing protein n=1 Tax=marine sediment metagenome TaxID=412755 RepID=A0A0F9VRZ9_9ZZZZ|nr:hypothetical protein [Pseudohongiella sp.]HDZ10031.1 hypothetical protein [Pseudohongiella sp.]HEA63380.1 hypothetical protein [Pseudohongiella sp.]
MSKPTKQNKVRVHSLELKGKGMERPVTAGVHYVSQDGLAHAVGSATYNPEPFAPKQAENQALNDSVDAPVSAAELAERARAGDIVDAIASLDLADDEIMTKNKGPKVAAIEAVLGFQITEADRDQAWQLFNQRG